MRTLLIFIVTVGLHAASLRADEMAVRAGDWTLRLDRAGRILSLADRAGRDLVVAGAGGGRPRVGMAPEDPARRWGDDAPVAAVPDGDARCSPTTDGAAFEYSVAGPPAFRVGYEISLTQQAAGTVLRRAVTITPEDGPVVADVMVSLGNPLAPPADGQRVFVPRKDGQGQTLDAAAGRRWIWPLAGDVPPPGEPAGHLAIPMLSHAGGTPAVRLTHVADPFFGTCLRLPDAAAKTGGDFRWVYQGTRVPLEGPATRTCWTVIHAGDPEKAMAAWYATALADIPPGPDWLHDIAWQHYDYLSHGGTGWFEDIDAVERLVPREDRSKILFTLHGWYGLVGDYAFDAAAGRLEDSWTAFPNAEAVRDKGFPTSVPVPMTRADMHRRIRYARERGLRVCLYFADGLTTCEAARAFSEDRILTWGGWQGPDTRGRSACQNPAHPEVRRWYQAYLQALLAEYGDQIDALVWDETFMIRDGAIGGAPKPDYAAPHFMRLTAELTRATTARRADLAFLASDCIGVTFDDRTFWLDVPPYAIMAHGCYQDSHSRPSVWPYGLFPNYRNVLWSCNWQAVTRLDYTRFGVEHYDTPVATSNGWLDDRGVARLDEAQRREVLDLFNRRKTRRQQIRWLEGPPPAFAPATTAGS